MTKGKYSNNEFIEDLMRYFEVYPDKIDKYLNEQLKTKNTIELYINAVVKDKLREEIKHMYKYECTKCKRVWYIAEPLPNAKKCDSCGGKIKNKGGAE